MIKIGSKSKNGYLLKAVISKQIPSFIIKKEGVITDDISTKTAYVYFESKISKSKLEKFAKTLAIANRDYDVDLASFVFKDFDETKIAIMLISEYEFINTKNIYNAKTIKKSKVNNVTLIASASLDKSKIIKAKEYASAINWTRNLQTTPPNILHSEKLAQIYKDDLTKISGLKVQVLNQKQIKELNMGLLLSVNSASKYEARVVIAEYIGDSKSKAKTVLVGKGITFDSGGMNIKTGKYMLGMKYDMSGSAIVMGAIKTIAKLKLKTNVAAVVALTDNMISATASQPDSVYTSMSGKTVEVNNTDAEGRLVMADAITYGVKKLKATRIVDVATLTGAIVVALGSTYTGVWSTTDKGWNDLQKAAKRANELVWRMPLHSDYFEFMKTSTIADMFNTDYTGKGGSSSAAMFLTQFSNGIEHIHLDVAGTASIKNKCMGPMVKTIVELVSND